MGDWTQQQREEFLKEVELMCSLRPHGKLFPLFSLLLSFSISLFLSSHQFSFSVIGYHTIENVVQLLGVSIDPLCIVTRYYKNGSLLHYLESSNPMDEKIQIYILKGITSGMVSSSC